MAARRREFIGFGPAGWALLVPLAALIWVAATGYDLRHQLLRGINWAFGWEWTYYWVATCQMGHFSALHIPCFSFTAFAAALLPLHFAPRRPAWWGYALLAAWAALCPAMMYILAKQDFPLPGVRDFVRANQQLTLVLVELATPLVFAAATRSWLVGALVLAAAPGFMGFAEVAGLRWSRGVPALVYISDKSLYGYHAALVGALTLWVVRERRRIRPEWACGGCGYDLRGAASGLCPECGAAQAT